MSPTHPVRKVFTGKAPFVGSTAPAVIASITSGKRPARPNHASFTDCLWELTQKCLEQAPSDRPSAEQALEVLRKLLVPPYPDGVHFAHKSSLRRAGQTPLTSPIPLDRSLEQETVSANFPAMSLITPAIHDILPKARTNGGGTVSPDQPYTQPAQTLGDCTDYMSSRELIHSPPQVICK